MNAILIRSEIHEEMTCHGLEKVELSLVFMAYSLEFVLMQITVFGCF